MNLSTTLSAEALLAIPLSAPERLFTGDEKRARREFRTLASLWHPDRNSCLKAAEVFQHLHQLYKAALRELQGGVWRTSEWLTLWGLDGTCHEIRYRWERPFELGRLFISANAVTWLVEKEYADLFHNAVAAISALRFADQNMAAEMRPNLPEVLAHFETRTYFVLILRKAPDLLPLRETLNYFSGRMDARHTAWVISSLLNLACYLDYAKLTHNAISTDSYFVSPQRHSGALLGGWWYAVRQGQQMKAAPAITMQYVPYAVMRHQRSDIRTDLELVRALGRELLGDITGMRLARDKAAPPSLLEWLRTPATSSPIDEYQTWQCQVLQESFGERRFVRLNLSMTDLP